MKSLLIGTLSLAMSLPALAAPASVTSAAGEKFTPTVRMNYTAVRRVAPRAGYRGYGYRGGYWRGGRYYGYGYRYPYWGGYYGYPYAAAFAFGLPLAYGAGYYAAAAPGYGYYGNGYPQGYYNGQIVAETSPGRIGPSSHSNGGGMSRTVQGALQSHGYYNGPVDGLFGPQSQQAMAQFQQANGLKVTGLIDPSSLKALGVR